LSNLKSIEITLTNNELEALLMEQYLIKEKKPIFNVQFKDDKGYPWIKIESSKEFPSAKSFLGRKDKNNKFFGPFPSSYAVQDSLRLLQKTFKLRNCSDSFFKNRTRPCIQHEIGRCSAPCVGQITKKEYMQDVNSTELLLSGKSEKLISSFYHLMDKHSKAKSFEKAASYRDKISSLRDVQRNQSVVGFSKERDAITVFTINGQTKAGITHVNNGWVTGHENFIQKNNLIEGSILEYFIQTYYLSAAYCPSSLVIGESIKNKQMIEKALSKHHSKNVKIICKLGKRDQGLIKICENNTKFSFNKKIDHKNTMSAFISLKEELSLTKEIRFVESYDISHHSGSAAIGGRVVFSERGKFKEKYKLFNISKENSGDDISSMVEVIERRFKDKGLDLLEPSLIVLDGGRVHLSHVLRKLKEMGLKEIPVIAISKGARRKADMDLVHTERGYSPITRGSLAHKFIQEIRDETHRFAITNQKRKQRKLSVGSMLDNLKGVGPKRKKMLIRYFGSVEQIKRASSQDIMNVPGLGKITAVTIYNQLK
jgi:excinuclease ABC subunit C